MSRNYKAIHYIQDRLKGFDPKFIECAVRQFNMIDSKKQPDGCLSNSVVLYICAKEYGYTPKLCYGLCVYDGMEFYHAWLELDDIIIDLSVYGNVNFSLHSMWKKKLEVPYVGSYDDSEIHYGRFEFDNAWSYAKISKAEGMTFEEYMDGLPQNAMWKQLCGILDKTASKDLVNHFRNLIKDAIIQRD